MAKKPRSQRRGGGGGGGAAGAKQQQQQQRGSSQSDSSSINDVDYLSESHTIATSLSSNNNRTSTGGGGNTMEDDPSWGIDDDYDHHDADGGGGAGGGGGVGGGQSLEAAERHHAKLVEALDPTTIDEYTTEKRSAKREQWLKGWFQALTQYANVTISADFLNSQRDGLLQACRQGVRAGTPSEQYAACRVMEAGAVVMIAASRDDGDGSSYYHEIQGHLRRLIVSAHRAVPVRMAALRAMGMAVYLGVDDDEITEQILELCENMAQPEYRGDAVPSALRAAALEVWTLLATTIHELYVAGKDDVSTGRGLLLLPLLLECLEQTEDSSLRSAAGESVAWIHTARLELGVVSLDTEATTTSNSNNKPYNTTQKQYQQGSWEGSEWEDIMAELEQVIHQLSNQSGHHMSKKAKKEQRANFREYLATIQDDEPPEEVVQFRGGSLELNSWKEIVALQFVRRCLQGGFQMQLLTNPTLQAVFGADGRALGNSAGGGMSQLEKRLYMSKTSEAAKVKDIDRHKKRDKRRNIKNHFLTADGDDI